MRLGAQVSVSGGLHNAFQNGRDISAETVMFYTKSNRQWKAKALTEKEIKKYNQAKNEYDDITPVVVHAAYLMNLASPKEDIWQKSYDALVVEINRVAQIGESLMVMHPGSHMDEGEEAGLERIANGLQKALAETAESAPNVIICLEVMAGQGTNLGFKFEHLAYLIENGGDKSRLGVCLDTCHMFAAGYDIRTPEAYEATMQEFDRVVGFDYVKCFHFNDSKYDFDSRRDRHEHIGKGYLGEQAFANFVNDPRWKDHPAHLETPKTEEDDEGNKMEMDPVNLDVLRNLIVSE